ncbi:mitochondrial carrier domain-containing protein [Phakopsora pachyrhizi]|uniref:Mitochondrial carrier domain-containing protein n=1 Tax=Phakopsora pachyrhizi TaxID=170000 RepID=A0AAV0BEQ4_PHAPC|nr:mitochondrial carrier domain-containing protein [Phakopsora pachyrhizi]CAH7685566.1 mitochondrial carrier domain-containing protein [Phakopsora pachyrhizi]
MGETAGNRKPLPFIYTFSAGAIAGVTELLCLYPLDVVKTRIQLQGKVEILGQENYTGMVDCFKKIIKAEGFGRLYRGLLPPLMLEAPKRAVKFAANDFWGTTYKTLLGTDKVTQNLALMTGMSAGATESIVVVPFELVKIRLQDRNSTYKGPLDVVMRTIRAQGVLGLYGGLESTFWRHVWWNGGYFASIFKIKAMMPKPNSKSREITNNFISGSIGGCIGTMLNTPFDVVKSRIQNSTVLPGQAPKYGWTYPAIALVAKEEGLSALYKGFLPKVLRLAPGGGVLLVVVEVVTGFFRIRLGPPYA